MLLFLHHGVKVDLLKAMLPRLEEKSDFDVDYVANERDHTLNG